MCAFSLPEYTVVNRKIEDLGLGVKNFLQKKYSGETFGVVIRDTPLRMNPTLKKRRSKEGFDLSAESLCRCCEVVMLLQKKAINGFYKVATANSKGYIRENMVGLINYSAVVRLLSDKNMLCITDKFVLTNPSPFPSVSKVPLSFGTRLPIGKSENSANYTVLLPGVNDEGRAVWETAYISKTALVSQGFLKFTRKNILQLSLRMRGMPYDWGESFGGCDCSSLVCMAFSLCGVVLPRNSDKIARICKKPIVVNNPYAQLKKCRPADLLLCDGHVMLYYGKHKGRHYVFHSFYGSKGITDITPVEEISSGGKPIVSLIKKIIPLKNI